jgi:signal transduction histidine kinase/CheY-like chemotaxis protein
MSTGQRLTRLVLWFLPPSLRDAEADTLRRAKLCAVYNLTVPLWGPGFALLLWLLDQPMIAAIIAGGTIGSVGSLLVLRRTGSLVLAGNLMAAEGAFLIVLCAWLEGGLGSPGIIWFPLVPMLAVLVAGWRSGVAWTVLMVAVLTAYYGLDCFGYRVAFSLHGRMLVLLHLALATSAVVLFAVLAAIFESHKVAAMRSLETANRALGVARDQAEAATRAKSEFLANMSHEIRTPIHGIFGMTELALDASDEDDRREFMERARACAETLIGVINDILDFSRMEAAKVTLEQVEFDPRVVLDGVLDTLTAEAVRKDLELVGCVDAGVPARVCGDPGRFRQILVNLAGNAVKFTDRGEVIIRLEPAEADAPGSDPPTLLLRGSVRDTGIGIPREKQALIFEAFTQADSSTTRSHGGTGLGLAIARRLVGLMGGQVELQSAPDAGSVFRFTVRLGAAAQPPEPAAELPPGLRVLIVDRGGASRRHLVHTLAAWGVEPTPAADGDAACEALATAHTAFDVVVLDLTLPAAERFAVVQRLRSRSDGRRTALVGLVPTGRAEAARGQGPELVAVVSKPIKSGPLLAAVAAAAQRSRPEATAARHHAVAS